MNTASSSQSGSTLPNPQWLFLHHIAPENHRQAPLCLQCGGGGVSTPGDAIPACCDTRVSRDLSSPQFITCEDADAEVLEFLISS